MTSVTNMVSFKRLVYETKCIPWRLGNVGECVTVVLQECPDLSGSRDRATKGQHQGGRAAIGQLWRLELLWDSSAQEERCHDHQEARLPEAGVLLGMVSL